MGLILLSSLALGIFSSVAMAAKCTDLFVSSSFRQGIIEVPEAARLTAKSIEDSLNTETPGEYLRSQIINPIDLDWHSAVLDKPFYSNHSIQIKIRHKGVSASLRMFVLPLSRPSDKAAVVRHFHDRILPKMMLQSALARHELAQPILKIVNPKDAHILREKFGQVKISNELIRGTLSMLLENIYFAILFERLNSENAIVSNDPYVQQPLPRWYHTNHNEFSASIDTLAKALNKIGVSYGPKTSFFITKDGKVILGDFDYLGDFKMKPGN